MIILTIKTDQPQAYIGIVRDLEMITSKTWEAHRELGATIHTMIKELLDKQSLNLHDIEGIVCFKGPGSFTGLRIGLATANVLSYALQIPIVSAEGVAWEVRGARRLMSGENEKVTVPNYGSDAHITAPKK